jgi:hypothetical protein
MPRTSHYADKPRRTTSSENIAPRPREAVSDAELAAYVKQVVDKLPPLTEAQLDMLALIFRGQVRAAARS